MAYHVANRSSKTCPGLELVPIFEPAPTNPMDDDLATAPLKPVA